MIKGKRQSLIIAVAIAVAGVFFFPGCSQKPEDQPKAKPTAKEITEPAPIKEAHKPTAEAEQAEPQKISHRDLHPDSCQSCHADVHKDWAGSHHALANHFFDFENPDQEKPDWLSPKKLMSIEHAGVKDNYSITDSKTPKLKWSHGKDTKELEIAGAIGTEPLIQLLIPKKGGRLQALSVAHDIDMKDWFYVFGDDKRAPTDWGHWFGEGMNWNSNCAYCHMTRFEKNFNPLTNSFDSKWTHNSITCIQCHDGIEEHMAQHKDGSYKKNGKTPDPAVRMEMCATCHARRGQLTADEFRPGDSYWDHFDLTLADMPGIYYADGQIREEDYVYGSFLMSKMHMAGVSCTDCHDPHTNNLKQPVENNAICMQCHGTGNKGARIINPTEHSHHGKSSKGNSCVACHMPHRTYMERDPRRDHGFHSPDPLLTKELGVPNACSNCHDDKPIEWAIKHHETWFGETPTLARKRSRARLLTKAQEADASVATELTEAAATDPNLFWRATFTNLLRNFAPNESVIETLRKNISDSHPLVRASAASYLAELSPQDQDVGRALNDKSRLVRVWAGMPLQSRNMQLPPQAQQDVIQYYMANSERPIGLLFLAQQAQMGRDKKRFEHFADLIAAADANNPEVFRQLAILYSMGGDNEGARKRLSSALELDPTNVMALYSLALLEAESNAYADAEKLLLKVIETEPRFERAWYNLALLQHQQGSTADAIQTVGKGLGYNQGSTSLAELLDFLKQF